MGSPTGTDIRKLAPALVALVLVSTVVSMPAAARRDPGPLPPVRGVKGVQAVKATIQADSYVSAASPSRTYGDASTLRVDGTPRRAYVRFALRGVVGRVAKATLGFYALRNSEGVTARNVADTSWSEAALTFTNAPASSAAVTASSGPIAWKSWVWLDVTEVVQQDGVYSFALTTLNGSGAAFAARERNSWADPQLVVEQVLGSPVEQVMDPPVEHVIDSTPPTQPTNLRVANISESEATVSWMPSTDDSRSVSYDVYRDGAKVGTAAAPSFQLTGLTCGTAYNIMLVARDEAGNVSPPSSLTIATTACAQPLAPDVVPPSAPTGLVVTGATATEIQVEWIAAVDNVGVSNYQVSRDGVQVGETTRTMYTFTGLTCGTSYVFGVRANDDAGNYSLESTVIAATASCPDAAAPTTPLIVAATAASETTISLAWGASFDNIGVAGYGLYRGGTLLDKTALTTYTFTGLQCGTSYVIGVDAYDAAGNRSPMASVIAPTAPCPDVTPPTAPTNVAKAGATETTITVAWTPSTDNVGVSGYYVYNNGARIASTPTPSHTLTGLACGTSYTLAVEAHDAAGNRSNASAITLSTASCPPPSCPTGEYSAEYYGNVAFSGAPVLKRCEAALNHSWGSGSPVGVPTDGFSARWTGIFSFTAGTYQFTATADDGIRVWVDGTLVIDSWKDQSPTTYHATSTITPGNHDVKVEYYENGGGAVAIVGWQPSVATPPPSDAYFVSDFASQDFRAPWTTLFSYSSPGWVNVATGSSTATPDRRVAVVPAPGGSGHAARFEIRDSDPGWPGGPTKQKSELRTVTLQTFNQPGVTVGDVRWFSTRLYMPYTADEKFEWAHGGSNPFINLLELHTASSSMWSAIRLGWYPSTPQWASFRVYGGDFANPNQYAETIKLWQLTDASGNRIMQNHNRWIDLVWGMRFAPDSTGWLEVWVDGANVYPRKNRPTMWLGDTGQYLKQGLYKMKDASFPSGRSVVYFGPTRISYSKP